MEALFKVEDVVEKVDGRMPEVESQMGVAVHYLNQEEALAEIRKVTALGVVTLETHGCPERK